MITNKSKIDSAADAAEVWSDEDIRKSLTRVIRKLCTDQGDQQGRA